MVVSIISVLTSVLLVSLSSARAKARDSIRIQHFTQIRNALMLYAGGNTSNLPTGHYFSLYASNVHRWNLLETELAPYISPLPIDPKGGSVPQTNYWYAYLSPFATNWVGSDDTGSCIGKTVLFATFMEGGTIKRDCIITGGAVVAYPNYMTVVIQ